METLGFNSPSLNPKNVLPQWQQKIANAENNYSSISTLVAGGIFRTKCDFLQVLLLGRDRREQPAHFLADLRNAALSAFEEGAPFMGTALAAYKQSHWAEVVCHFHLLFIPFAKWHCKNKPKTNTIQIKRQKTEKSPHSPPLPLSFPPHLQPNASL